MSASSDTPVGTHRIWREEFIQLLFKKSALPISWIKIGEVNKAIIDVKAPRTCGIYAFVRKSHIEKLTPFTEYPLIVYIGHAIDLHQRLLDYVDDKRTSLRYTEGNSKVRTGIRSMFRTYKDALVIYVFECCVTEVVSIEDALIKAFDPVFNEKQKMPSNIEESEESLTAHYGAPQVAYESLETVQQDAGYLLASIGLPQNAF